MSDVYERSKHKLEIINKQIEIGETKGASWQTLSNLKRDKQMLEFLIQGEESRIKKGNVEYKELADMLMGKRKPTDTNSKKDDGKIRLPG